MDPQAKIVKEKGGWSVYNEDESKKLGGPYKTKEEAEERLRQVEHFKNASAEAHAAAPKRARYLATGFLALDPKAFGLEFAIAGGVPPKPFDEVGQVAVIQIAGPIDQHPSWLCQDYETIRGQVEAAFASNARAVALCINSPGGAAAGCFELARALRAMSEASGKPLGVFVDGQAASAAYALACAATPGMIHAPPTSSVGSLAVYEMMVDQTQADAQLGLKFLFVPSSGADLKLTGNPHLPPTEAQVAHTQTQVDLLTDYFYSLVEEMRGVSQDAIRALRGASLLATQGLDKGLVDAISDWNGFLAALESHQGQNMNPPQAKASKAEDKDEKSPWHEMMSTLHSMAEGEDEEKAKKARKMLRAALAEEKTDEKEEPESKAAAEPEDEPKKDEPKAAGGDYIPKAEGEEEAKKAQALASAGGDVTLALAKQVQTLLAERAQEKEAARRAELFAKRPDFSAEVRKSLAQAPVAVLEDAVKNWPRVNVADPKAAAASAAVPGATPGETDGHVPGLRHDEHTLLARLDRRGPQATQAKVVGSSLVLSNMTPEAAAKRVEEMKKNGLAPRGIPHDMARITNTEFKVPAK